MKFKPITIALIFDLALIAVCAMVIHRAESQTISVPAGATSVTLQWVFPATQPAPPVTQPSPPVTQPSPPVTQPSPSPTPIAGMPVPSDPNNPKYDPKVPLVSEPDGTVGMAGINYPSVTWRLTLLNGLKNNDPAFTRPAIDPTPWIQKAVYWSTSSSVPGYQSTDYTGTSFGAAQTAMLKAGANALIPRDGNVGMVQDSGWNSSGTSPTQLAIFVRMGPGGWSDQTHSPPQWASGSSFNISGKNRSPQFIFIDPGVNCSVQMSTGDSGPSTALIPEPAGYIWIQRANVTGNGASISVGYAGKSLTFAPETIVIADCQVHDVWGGTGQRFGIYSQQLCDLFLNGCSLFNCMGGIPPGGPKVAGETIYNQGIYLQSSASQQTSNVPINQNQPQPMFRANNCLVAASGNEGAKGLPGGVWYGCCFTANGTSLFSDMYDTAIGHCIIAGDEGSFGTLMSAVNGSVTENGNPFIALADGTGGSVASPSGCNEGGAISFTTVPKAWLWDVAIIGKSNPTPNDAAWLNVSTYDGTNAGNDPPQSSSVYCSFCVAPTGWYHAGSTNAVATVQTNSATTATITYSNCSLLGLTAPGNNGGAVQYVDSNANLAAWGNSVGIAGNAVDAARAMTLANPRWHALDVVDFVDAGLTVK